MVDSDDAFFVDGVGVFINVVVPMGSAKNQRKQNTKANQQSICSNEIVGFVVWKSSLSQIIYRKPGHQIGINTSKFTHDIELSCIRCRNEPKILADPMIVNGDVGVMGDVLSNLVVALLVVVGAVGRAVVVVVDVSIVVVEGNVVGSGDVLVLIVVGSVTSIVIFEVFVVGVELVVVGSVVVVVVVPIVVVVVDVVVTG